MKFCVESVFEFERCEIPQPDANMNIVVTVCLKHAWEVFVKLGRALGYVLATFWDGCWGVLAGWIGDMFLLGRHLEASKLKNMSPRCLWTSGKHFFDICLTSQGD